MSKLLLILFATWTVLTILSFLLTFSALVYTFVVSNETSGQSILPSTAASLPRGTPYPDQSWTPENWFVAVLQLSLVNQSDRDDIESHLRIIRGWKWNLIPMFILGLAVCGVATAHFMRRRKANTRNEPQFSAVEPKAGSQF